jgi:glycosyltransferase involved in cell wall biosynthesis
MPTTPSADDVQFHVLSFEGPDRYAFAGGIASRISGLTESLAEIGHETHLWFVGDPALPGHESRGDLALHRWCQWISAHHPNGVYDGEEGKQADYARSLPPFLLANHLRPHLLGGGRAVVLAEEWQSANAVLHLDWLLREAGLRAQVEILWNANNVFGFERIDWPRLMQAATITTVSRYMRHCMRPLGVEALVIPNGLSSDAFAMPDRAAVAEFRRRFGERPVIAKMARWDPDKRWLLAVETAAALKRQGLRPLLVARGGLEAHGHEVLAAARTAGLHVVDRRWDERGERGLLQALTGIDGADVVNLRSHVDPLARRLLFRGASAVLANSGHEPFGLVGLEAMAVGGLACTGYSGEDYAVAGRNAVVLQTNEPGEFVVQYLRLRDDPIEEQSIRRAGRVTSRHYAWSEVIARNLLPRIGMTASLAPARGPIRAVS